MGIWIGYGQLRRVLQSAMIHVSLFVHAVPSFPRNTIRRLARNIELRFETLL